MARNDMPEIECVECLHEPEGDESPLLVPSPRTGVCGSTGPAEPPY